MNISPNWDLLNRRVMFIPFFVYGDGNGPGGSAFGLLEGFCRGHGAMTGKEKWYESPIGIYTVKGVYHYIQVDCRIKCALPTFYIDDKPFYYPIVACATMNGGVPVVDPATGDVVPTSVMVTTNPVMLRKTIP